MVKNLHKDGIRFRFGLLWNHNLSNRRDEKTFLENISGNWLNTQIITLVYYFIVNQLRFINRLSRQEKSVKGFRRKQNHCHRCCYL